MLQVLALTDNIAGALPVAQEVADAINKDQYSTQEAAFAALAMDRLFVKTGNQSVRATVGGQAVTTAKSVYSQPVTGKVEVKNTSDQVLYATLMTVAKAPAGTLVPAAANGLKLVVSYLDASGSSVKVDSVPQGTELTVQVQVTNTTPSDLRSLALSASIPSGWEILNDRMRGGSGQNDGATYRDIRDNRCDWFFDLQQGKSRTFTMKVRAAYEGSYTLPSVTCSAMYNPHVAANTASAKTVVTR